MPKRSKRYLKLKEKVDRTKLHKLDEAIKILKELATAKFDETVELSLRLNVDPRKPEQIVRGAVSLPHGTGKKVKVLVFATGEKEKEAKEAGADYVGYTDLIEKIKKGWLDFDYVVSIPECMPEVSKLGRILGPRGLMPSPKTGTLTKEVGQIVKELKKGRVEFKTDKTGNLHIPVGKISFPEAHILENILAVMEEVLNLKPEGVRGVYIKSVYLSTTMSPSVKLDLNDIMNRLAERR